MKKYLTSFLALAPVLCFGADWLVTGVNVYTNIGAAFNNSPVVVSVSKPFPVSELDDFLLSRNFTLGFRNVYNGGFQPQIVGTTNLSLSVAFPFKFSDGVNTFYGDWSFAPRTYALFSIVNSLYSSGFTNGIHVLRSTASDLRLNFNTRQVIDSILYGVDTPFKSRVLSLLSSASTSINNIQVDLGQFQSDYQSVNSLALHPSNFTYASMPNIAGSSDYNYAVDSVLQSPYYSDSFKSLLASSLGSSYSDYLLDAAQMYQLDQLSPGSPGYGKSFNDYLNSPGSAAASKNYHSSTPLTNELRRMSLDWSRDTTNQLARNTQNITNQLAQWKSDLHDDVDNIGGALGSVITDNGGLNSLRVDIVGAGDVFNSVSIDGDITISGTQWSTIGDGFDNVEAKLDGILNEFKKWAWDDPLGWSKYFVNFYSSHSLSNQATEISILHSLTNFLSKSLVAVTSNVYQVSNDFAFSALLLDDYQTFIDSSKYNNIISSLSPDLSSALSSFGFSDSSEYSGRWWAFITANSAYQSTLLSTNAALASTLLSALEQIDDDEEGSLLSRWLSLIRSLPDPEELQIMLSDASNIVSNVGFDRVDSFYNTVTSDFANVTKNVFRDKSLPSVLSLTYLPAIEGRAAKVVEIPVGEHASLWSLFRGGMAFAISVVTLILFPKYLSWLLTHYISLVQRVIRSLHAYTHA